MPSSHSEMVIEGSFVKISFLISTVPSKVASTDVAHSAIWLSNPAWSQSVPMTGCSSLLYRPNTPEMKPMTHIAVVILPIFLSIIKPNTRPNMPKRLAMIRVNIFPAPVCEYTKCFCILLSCASAREYSSVINLVPHVNIGLI